MYISTHFQKCYEHVVRKQKDITSAKAVGLTAFRQVFLGYPDKVLSGTSKSLTRTSNAIRILFIIRPINFASFLCTINIQSI